MTRRIAVASARAPSGVAERGRQQRCILPRHERVRAEVEGEQYANEDRRGRGRSGDQAIRNLGATR